MDYGTVYTIEFKGSKGWEVYETFNREKGIHAITQIFIHTVVNDREDIQWRLTTPTFSPTQ